jgi:hypothetical protein
VVEHIIDGWLTAHPEHQALPHLEDVPPATDNDQAQANASIGATDPGAIPAQDEPVAETDDAAAVTEDEPARAG